MVLGLEEGKGKVVVCLPFGKLSDVILFMTNVSLIPVFCAYLLPMKLKKLSRLEFGVKVLVRAQALEFDCYVTILESAARRVVTVRIQ